MKVGDNEIGLLFNVRARINIAQLTETKKMGDIGSLFDVPEDVEVENVYRIARALNHEYERKRKDDAGIEYDKTENQAIIQLDDVYNMTNEEYNQFSEELINVLKGERTVEAEPVKGKKQEAKPSN
jgi:hypothetical protein